ncbi:MSMEG_4193 family putative phosphomutase [Nocardiopsis algeriensis]|uniref:MSMEG_4193 family putative phosphomutase n=1 Tax=Nocardiopsis algeriensis TaxID=1478215 RepID=UPI003B4385D6
MATPEAAQGPSPSTEQEPSREWGPRDGGAPQAVTLVLVRHGMTDATGPSLAGRTPGIHLNDTGRAQAADLARRLSDLRPAALVSSPLERCRETAQALSRQLGVPVTTDERFVECDYGSWTLRPFTELRREPLWKVVQEHPSAVRFPAGEGMAAAAARAAEAVRDWNTRLLDEASAGDTPAEPPVYVVCSHGDIIKALVADALGMHLDLFQRIVVDPCSATSITYTHTRPFLNLLNDTGDNFPAFPSTATTSGDAAVGGGAGTAGRSS